MSKNVKKYQSFEWIDITNPSKEELLDLTAGLETDINLLEDSLEYGHLPKIEVFENLTFIIFRAYAENNNDKASSVGQLSNKIAFFLYKQQLITIHRAEFPFLQKITGQYRHPQLLLIDIVNEMLLSYEHPIQQQFNNIDDIEKLIFLNKNKSISIETLYYQKAQARISKKILQLTQLVLNQIKVEPEFSSALQDLKDTTVSLILQNDEIIEDGNTILNSYLGLTAQKSNAVMKLLTIFSAFFLPLTFIAGIYGMNFAYMPELTMRYGYFGVLAVMVGIALVIYLWFKRKQIL